MAKRTSKAVEPPVAGAGLVPPEAGEPTPPAPGTEEQGQVDLTGIAPEGTPPIETPAEPKAPKAPKAPKPWRGVKMEPADLTHVKDFEAAPASVTALPGFEEIDQSLWTDPGGNVYYLDQTARGVFTLRPWKMVVS